MKILPDKLCFDCRKILTFQEFRINNPSLSLQKAIKLWKDPLITPYCPNCFLNRPEKPYKTRKRDFSYYKKSSKT